VAGAPPTEQAQVLAPAMLDTRALHEPCSRRRYWRIAQPPWRTGGSQLVARSEALSFWDADRKKPIGWRPAPASP
jgi:hypothetical protein